MNFNFAHVFLLGWPVLSVLLLCSIVSLAITLQCWTTLRRSRALSAGDRHLLKENLELVDERLALLGTIANAAPFIGLLGTVIGIIRAFHSISMNTGGGITVVAGGIAEALVSTAAGLAVAIPASVVYNYFSFHSQRLAKNANLD